MRRLSVGAVAVAAMVTVAACGGSGKAQAANPAPTDHVLHLSFMQDPGQPPDP
ncbi:MAG: ABC-type dipeptide transport system, periplasmic component, partial [Dactylosporangium sp.]|nr:ABC-type dipeptide transport system, periplasmic component [Dactylosporangium sp.]